MRLLLSLVLGFGSLSWADPSDEPVHENFVFEVPGLAETGPAFVSWFFFRNGVLWRNGEIVSIDKLEWPTWDTNQIPITLVPAPKQKANLIIYDERKQLIEEVNLEKPFIPEEYYAIAKIKPAYYQIRIGTAQNHLELTSPYYDWYKQKKIASCEVDASAPKFDVKKNHQLRMCLETLDAYTAANNNESRQYYIYLDWPVIRGRENVSAAKSIERDLRVAARKKKMIFLVRKSTDGKIKSEIGLTMKETLPKFSFPSQSLPNTEIAIQSPDTKTISKSIYEQTLEDGAKVKVLAFYSDAMTEREIQSPRVGKYQIRLQIVEAANGKASDDTVKIEQTRTFEQRTGLLGYLRPLQAVAFGGFNGLSSSRGEENSFIGLAGIDLRYNWSKLGLQPYFSYENDLMHFGSNLKITEMKLGASRQLPWIEGAFYSLGYQEYQLSGKNTGSTRLGGISAIALSGGASQRFETWIIREQADFLFGNSQSYAFRFDVGRLWSSSADARYYIGSYIGFGSYSGYVINKLKNKELFGEDRLQVGIALGWVGPDSF